MLFPKSTICHVPSLSWSTFVVLSCVCVGVSVWVCLHAILTVHYSGPSTRVYSTYSSGLLIASCWSKIIVIFQPVGLKSYNIMKCLKKRRGGGWGGDSGVVVGVQQTGSMLNQIPCHLNNLVQGGWERQRSEMFKCRLCPCQCVFVHAEASIQFPLIR